MFARRTFNLMRNSSQSLRNIGKRNYSLKTLTEEYFPEEIENDFLPTDSEAADALPIMRYLDEDTIRDITERQRMIKLMDDDPDTFPQRKEGETVLAYFERQYSRVLPQIVEDFNFNALPEPEPAKIDDNSGAEDPTSRILKVKK